MFSTVDLNNAPVVSGIIPLHDDLYKAKGLQVFMFTEFKGPLALRGNKWHKLKYNLLEASKLKKDTLLTFGGAYSNHIAATACAAKMFGFKSIGIIRGDQMLPLNKTLSTAIEEGMNLFFENRENYRNKDTTTYKEELHNRFGDFYLIPEGGSNPLGLKGCSEIPAQINLPFDYICLPTATGTTMAGIITGLNPRQHALGIQVLKAKGMVSKKVNDLLQIENTRHEKWEVMDDYHFEGYAKSNNSLALFIDSFNKKHNLLTEPVYTGKMFYALNDLIKKDYFKPDSTIIALHTGGLQYL